VREEEKERGKEKMLTVPSGRTMSVAARTKVGSEKAEDGLGGGGGGLERVGERIEGEDGLEGRHRW
jgi:hypothetical protein